MHYLEDFLELLEPLRETMREKLTLMRENDLKFQGEYAQLEDDTNKFLTNYRLYQSQSNLSPSKSKINVYHLSNDENNQMSLLTSEQKLARDEKQKEYDQLLNRHKQLSEITSQKSHLANESQEFVERYYKKLESDLHKFKMELEADYAGITEVLEKRFENENYQAFDEKTNENSNFDPSLIDLEPLLDSYDDTTLSNTLNDDYLNGFFNSQGRRLSNGLTPSMLNRKQQQRLQTLARGRKRLQDKSKRKRNPLTDSPYINPDDSDQSSPNTSLNLTNNLALTGLFDDDIHLLDNYSNQPTTIDERRYCFCNEMSYGEMIACDNSHCRREWFHYSCVGIVTPPKGKWYCSDCSQIVQQKLSK